MQKEEKEEVVETDTVMPGLSTAVLLRFGQVGWFLTVLFRLAGRVLTYPDGRKKSPGWRIASGADTPPTERLPF